MDYYAKQLHQFRCSACRWIADTLSDEEQAHCIKENSTKCKKENGFPMDCFAYQSIRISQCASILVIVKLMKACKCVLIYFLNLGRHSPGSGCAGINGNNRDPNCRCPSSAILRPGDPDLHPVLVTTSEALDGQSTGASHILFHRGHPRFELAATLLAPMHWGLEVDDLTVEFAGRTSRSMPEPTKSTLKKHRSQSSKMELTAKDGARYTI